MNNIFCRNSSGSTPLHLAAATGHTVVVEYLLSRRGMSKVKAALDSEGKSPLAVCLEFKMNDWQRSAQLLRKAYKVKYFNGRYISSPLYWHSLCTSFAISFSLYYVTNFCAFFFCQSEDGGPISPSPLSSQASSIEHLLAAVSEVGSREDLELRGSQADITATPIPQHNAKKKKKKVRLSLFLC